MTVTSRTPTTSVPDTTKSARVLQAYAPHSWRIEPTTPRFLPISIRTVATSPFEDQKPGTSGLRKKTSVFQQNHYLECFVQSIFHAIGGVRGKTLVLGGDGREGNREAIGTILNMAAAGGAARIILGRDGLLSTPAASHLIRLRAADYGIILTASHNPGGANGDFGLKLNEANGGPASEALTEAIYAHTLALTEYQTASAPDVAIDRRGITILGGTFVEVVDPVSSYAQLLESQFDFDAIRNLFDRGFSICFDAMNGVNGPYAKRILEERLGAPIGSVINSTPLPDFGSRAPDPAIEHLDDLVDLMQSPSAPDLAAASDGDGDRNLVLAPGAYVQPSDGLAILAANAHLVPAFRHGLKGVGRSMPTSRALDRVATRLAIPSFETPTGWKYFCNLLDSGAVSLCGEESAGTGSSHIREKDGLWAFLMWLNIIAVRRASAVEIVRDHYAIHGRDYAIRYDFHNIDPKAAEALIRDLRSRLPTLPGTRDFRLSIATADEFTYTDPVSGWTSRNQGIRITFANGARAVIRISGTSTDGVTLRLYIEQFEPPHGDHERSPVEVLAPLLDAAIKIIRLEAHTGRMEPDAIS